jgi:hypothetical protein
MTAELNHAQRVADVVDDLFGKFQQIPLGRTRPVKGLFVRRRPAAHVSIPKEVYGSGEISPINGLPAKTVDQPNARNPGHSPKSKIGVRARILSR